MPLQMHPMPHGRRGIKLTVMRDGKGVAVAPEASTLEMLCFGYTPG